MRTPYLNGIPHPHEVMEVSCAFIRVLGFVGAMMMLVACRSMVEHRFTKPGASQKDFSHDHAACQDSMGMAAREYDPAQILEFVIPHYQHSMVMCLEDRGWTLLSPRR